jgi:hypothetical protein
MLLGVDSSDRDLHDSYDFYRTRQEMTFEDKFYLIVSIAQRRAGPRYEIDELVNEAWLTKKVRMAKNAKHLCMAGHWAMLDYIRNDKRKHKQFNVFLEKEGRRNLL